MDKKTSIIVGIIVLIILVALVIAAKMSMKPSSSPSNTVQDLQNSSQSVQVTPQGVVVATGTSAIASSGQVVTPSGKPVQLNVAPGSEQAPQQSAPITASSTVPSRAIKLTVSASGFSPKTFAVNSGDPVVLSVTSGDDQSHVFKFRDPALEAVAMGLAPHETRLITFNAPKAGSYDFYCDVPGHANRGETGTMTVK